MPDLVWVPPEQLYAMVANSGMKVTGVDFGSRTSGICVGVVADVRYAYPAMVLGNLEGNYVLSPLEDYYNSFSDGEGTILDHKWFLPYDLFSPQVTVSNPQQMHPSVMRDILNTVADDYNVGYYVFGFSAHDEHWNNEANYTFVRAEIQKLERDGNLMHKMFTIVDETNSTNKADRFLDDRFPELRDGQTMLNMYPDIEQELGWYYVVDGQVNLPVFQSDLDRFRQRLLDCYSASHFTRLFLDRGYRGILLDGARNQAKDRKMMDFAENLGYDVTAGRDPSRYEEA